jgi:opacity protein-like surface antigen
MKQCRFAFYSALLVVLLAGAAIAENEEESGFFGNLTIGGGYAAGRPSQLEVTDDNKVLVNLNDRVETYLEAVPVLMAEFGYVFAGTGTAISVGVEGAFDNSAVISISQPLGKPGFLSLGFEYGLVEVWKDPYLVGVERTETDETTAGLTLDYADIFGTGARLSISGSQIGIDDDAIGYRQPELRRDGSRITAGAGYTIVLAQGHAITPNIELTSDTRDGESESSTGYNFTLNHSLTLGKWIFDTTLSAGETEYDAPHPIFNRTREEKMFAVTEWVTYEELFGHKNFSIYGLVTYGIVDANISFFDSNVLIIGMGVGYSF